MTSKLIVVRTLFVYEFFVLKDYYYLDYSSRKHKQQEGSNTSK